MKTLRVLLWILAAIVIFVVIGMFTMGGFQKVTATSEEAGPIKMVYMEHKGPYSKVTEKIEKVKLYLDSNKIACTESIGEYLSDPTKVKQEDLMSNIGFIVDQDCKDSAPFMFKNIPKQLFVSVNFKGSPAVGPMKAYPAMDKWVKDNGYEINGSGLEIYKVTGKEFTTHYLMPIKKK
jgi:effector-binding domain-containing protein